MSMKELKELLQLSKEELQHMIGIKSSEIRDIEYAMSQEDWYRHIYPNQEIDKDMEHYRAELQKEKHQLQKLMFVAKLKLIF
ncbi:hypothetical protein [Clostridium sp. KNHs214]|uniref:hypothetical protein n=1 Tax=Clostridium sp. KNHs214 TaxID=1540257 RepID=UPI0005525B75|nr:hypothetical protein [Clostridium sp. KNHs214]